MNQLNTYLVIECMRIVSVQNTKTTLKILTYSFILFVFRDHAIRSSKFRIIDYNEALKQNLISTKRTKF